MEQEKYSTKKRKWKHISEKERYKIETLSQQGLTPAVIGKVLTLKRDRRTIERELSKGITLQRNSDLTVKQSKKPQNATSILRSPVQQLGTRKQRERQQNPSAFYS